MNHSPETPSQALPTQTPTKNRSTRQPSARNRYPSSCTCGARWNGENTAHCSGCHQTFTGLTAFDKHRSGSHVTGRHCQDPWDIGLVDAGRAYQCWGFPNTDGWTGPK